MNTPLQIPDFVYGAQYYRMPTPLPGEWDHDFANFPQLELNAIQLRIQWRANERIRDQYRFDDIDRLVELSGRHHQRIIIKFLLETAPDYIFQELHGAIIGLDGRECRPYAHGAFYVGGRQPCFHHPAVLERAREFIRQTVLRYRGLDHLMLWNVWNEPRIKMNECCCPHSLANYRNFLRQKFGSIDNLNRSFGKSFADFDSVMPPGGAQDYAELFLWRLWALDTLRERLRILRDTVREFDDSPRPVIAHAGSCTALCDIAGDGSDDLANAAVFDFYGTSLPTGETFDTPRDRTLPLLNLDWMRSVSEYFWVYELYPEWGDWEKKIAIADFRYKVMSAIGGGARGLLFWQYRAERLGNENDLAGLVNLDGSFKPVSHECARLGRELTRHADFLMRARVVCDRIGIVYDLESDMINRIENTGSGPGDFQLRRNPAEGSYLYKDNLWGVHALFCDLKLTPELVDSRLLDERLERFDVLYLPEWFMLTPEKAALLRKFVERGGLLLAEEGLALRRSNTWLNYPWPGEGMAELFGVSVAERNAVGKLRSAPPAIATARGPAAVTGFAAYLEPAPETEVLARWQDSRAAITRHGTAIFIGAPLGHAYFHTSGKRVPELLRELLDGRVRIPTYPDEVFVRTLETDDERRYVVFNRSDVAVSVTLDGKPFSIAARDSIIRAPTQP